MKKLMKGLRWIALGAMVLLALGLLGCDDDDDTRDVQFFRATLTGTQEVPPNNSTATGSAIVFVIREDQAMDVTLDVEGLDLATVTGAHIHAGEPGENGPVIFNLFTGPTGAFTDPFGPVHLTAGDLISTPDNAPVEVDNFREAIDEMEDGDLYVNIHTTAFPDGEIRGQLVEVP